MPRLAQPPAPQRSLRQTLARWEALGEPDLWVFAYASLIWRPEFDPRETRAARIHGWHRALNMWSTLNRGTPEEPGLVFAMLPGGVINGQVQCLCSHRVRHELPKLWEREMPLDVYTPRWLRAATPQGRVLALAFTLPHSSPKCCTRLSDAQLQHIFTHASGRYGSTQDYALSTQTSLHAAGIADPELDALIARATAGLDT